MNIFLAKVEDNKAILDEEESWHCARVLRKRPGDELRLIDGRGNFYEARLTMVSDRSSEAVITKGPVQEEARGYKFHLAIAPTKQMDRMEWLVEKAVEIGIDAISFVICDHSERTSIKTERLQKIALSAVKQSLQASLPLINEAANFADFLREADAPHKYIAWCGDAEKVELRDQKFSATSSIVLIGPEGDFSEEEVGMAHQKGFINLSLGVNRLRTETAGLAVVQAAALL